MIHLIAMPRLGMKMREGSVVEWRAQPGEAIEAGQVVLVIESDKAEVEIEASHSGFLRHRYIQSGESVACGCVLAALSESADEPFDPADHATPELFGAPDLSTEPREVSAPAASAKAPAAPGAPGPLVTRPGRHPIAPAARRRAQELGLNVEEIPGSGPGGRVTREDVDAQMRLREARVEVAEGVYLEVQTEGQGEQVVLIPGFGSDASVFAYQLPALREHYRASTLHPRGVGLSDGPEAAVYEVGLLANDTAVVVEGAAHLVGVSLGAAIALELALRAPESVRSLTLITPFIELGGRLAAVLDAWCRIATEAAAETLAGALIPWLFSPEFLADEARRRRSVAAFARAAPAVPPATLARSAAGMRAWSGSRREDLSRVSAPTLVITAGQDLLAPDGEEVAAAIPKSRLVVVPGAGHAVTLEAPQAVNTALLEHLAAHGEFPANS
ncbi:MAG: alpha/beta fold hydrolase [Myxococcota bacterium]